MNNIIRKNVLHRYDSESLRVFLLMALTIYAYYPFFSSSNIGAVDAQYYQYLLHDAIIQLENGFFPAYVGQSWFSPNGAPSIAGPYYLLLGQLLNALSFSLLSPLLIQHLTIFASSLSGVLITYILIRNVAPLLRWQAVFLAFAYVSSPGVMSLIFYMDMYFSFMAVPFVPGVFYGLARIYKKNDALAYVLTGSALALVWQSHPPIALWTSIFCLVFGLSLIILTRRNPVGFAALALLFVLLCLWQFFPVLSLGIRDDMMWGESNSARVDFLLKQLLLPIPDVFLPLSQGKDGLYFLQLGYSLWFVIVLSVITALGFSGTLLMRLMLALIAIILLFLYPLPGIGHFLWSSVPTLVVDLTQLWPNQRLYIILAAAACFVGALALQKIFDSGQSKIKTMLNIALAGLFVWNIYQVGFFIKHGISVINSNEATMSPKDSWSSPNNMYFIGFKLPPEYLQDLYAGTHAPWLKSRLLDAQKMPISEYDNEQFVINRCLESARIKNEVSINEAINFPFKTTLKEPLTIASLNLKPNIHYLLCADMSTANGKALFQLVDQQRREIVSLEIPSPEDSIDPKVSLKIINSEAAVDSSVRRRIGIPFYLEAQDNKEMTSESFEFRVWSQQLPRVMLYNVNVTSYELDNLPIRVESYTPYRATVNAKPEHKYIEIIKLFKPGYIAKVNGEDSPIIESERKTIIIPLKSSGLNEIELSYIGTSGMRASFYISAVSWCLVVVFLMVRLISHKRRLWKPGQIGNNLNGR